MLQAPVVNVIFGLNGTILVLQQGSKTVSNPYLIENCMHTNPATVKADATVYEAIQLIQQHRITGLTVIDEQRCVVGVISELDCLKAVLGDVYNEGTAAGGLVADYMTADVESCSPDDDIVAVAQSMLAARHRRRPVIKNGKLVGQLSCRNILWAILEYSGRQS